jgi:DSF synthase
MRDAEKMILSGRVYTAEDLHELGIVDILADDGAGEKAVFDFVRATEQRRNGMQAVFSCRQHFHRIGYEELLNITNVWVDASMRLEEKDLKMMSRLARSQFRRIPGGAPAEMREEARSAAA